MTARYVCSNPSCLPFECNSPLETCPLCRSKMVLTSKSTPKSWNVVLAEDDSLWYPSAFDTFPSVIAHEYARILTLCQEDKPYGMLFQIKDLLETVLKFEVLSVCAWAEHARLDPFCRDILSQITTPRLSLGSWQELAKLIHEYFDLSNHTDDSILPPAMAKALAAILSCYLEHNIVHWRNDQIGHGALGFAEDRRFLDDVNQKLSLIRSLFVQIDTAMRDHTILMNAQPYWGSQRAVNVPENYSLSMQITLKDGTCDTFTIEPYITAKQGSFFFFDTLKNNSVSQLQCYPNGYRREELIPYFSELNAIRRDTVDVSLALNSTFFTDTEDAVINQLSLNDNIIKPAHLQNWLNQCLNQHEKGVFLLKMCRGTGKSTFSEKLNRCYEHPLKLNTDPDVRTYHLQRAQMISTSDFEQTVEQLWAMHFNGKGTYRSRYKRISEYIDDGKTPAEALAAFLSDTLAFTKQARSRGQNRVLLVIDGLDEIVDEGLWAYLPHSGMLEPGVFILLTSRDPSQEANLPASVRAHIDALAPDEALSIVPNSDENKQFLRQYFKSQVFKGYSSKQIESILAQADYRILYLGMLCALLKNGYPTEPSMRSEQLLESFLKLLEDRYGPKEAHHLRELLALLCILSPKEPLSLNEIAQLWSGGPVTLDLLGKVNDLCTLLRVTRGFSTGEKQFVGENRYVLANPAIAEALKKLLPEVPEMARRLFVLAVSDAQDAVEQARASSLARMQRNGIQRADYITYTQIAIIIPPDDPTLLVLAHIDALAEAQSVALPDMLATHMDTVLEYVRMAHIENALSAQRCMRAMGLLKTLFNSDCDRYRHQSIKLLSKYSYRGFNELLSKEQRKLIARELMEHMLKARLDPVAPHVSWNMIMDAYRDADDLQELKAWRQALHIEQEAYRDEALRDIPSLLYTLMQGLTSFYRKTNEKKNPLMLTQSERSVCLQEMVSSLDWLRRLASEVNNGQIVLYFSESYDALGMILRQLGEPEKSLAVLTEGCKYLDHAYERLPVMDDPFPIQDSPRIRVWRELLSARLQLRISTIVIYLHLGREEDALSCAQEILSFEEKRLQFTRGHKHHVTSLLKKNKESVPDCALLAYDRIDHLLRAHIEKLSDECIVDIQNEIISIIENLQKPVPRSDCLRLRELLHTAEMLERPVDLLLIRQIEEILIQASPDDPSFMAHTLSDAYVRTGALIHALRLKKQTALLYEAKRASGMLGGTGALLELYHNLASQCEDEQERTFYRAKAEKLRLEIDASR